MKAIIKLFAVLFGLFLISCIALMIYVTTLDPNDYKSLIAENFQEQTGRSMTIDGDVSVTIYPWLGLELNGITIGNASGFGDEPFLHTDHAMVRIKFMPLLNDQYEIDTVRLHGASINLVKNEDGRTNWDDLMDKSGDGERPSDAGDLSLAAIILGGVDIRDASFTWDDRTTGGRHSISNLMMTTGELVFGEPIAVELTFDAVSNQPELIADVSLTSTITYDLDNEIYDVAPLEFRTVLAGPNIPQGSTDITIESAIRVNLDDETLSVSNLDMNALGTHFTGTIDVSDIMDPTPTVKTDINLTGNDLALLFKVAEIEPLATQLASLSDRSFDFSAKLEADMADGDVDISDLEANLLGANIEADISANNVQSDVPAIQSTFNASGPDLPTLLQVLGQLQGGADSSLTQLANQITGVGNRSFDLSASIDADMDDGDLNISGLQASLLGANIRGDIQASNIKSTTPAFEGTINATGPNLPSLMLVMGQMHGGAESPLTVYGRQFNGISNKSFDINAEFDVDMDRGDIDMPVLAIRALGLNVNGNLAASDMQQDNGRVNGSVAISGNSMGELLTALDHADLAEVLQSMDINAGISGTRNDLNINPMDMKLVFGGDQIPNSPVDLSLVARTRLNLEQDTLNLNNFRLSGLGLDMTGNLNANDLFNSVKFNGDVDVAPFSLRQLMQQLNKDAPNTADPWRI